MTTPEKYRDRLLRAAYALADHPKKSRAFLEAVDGVMDEITEATSRAFIAYETDRLGHPPTVEDWYRFQALAAKRAIA